MVRAVPGGVNSLSSPSMHVLLADKLSSVVAPQLAALGCKTTNEPSLKDDALTKRIAGLHPEVLVVRSTKVTRADIEASPRLS